MKGISGRYFYNVPLGLCRKLFCTVSELGIAAVIRGDGLCDSPGQWLPSGEAVYRLVSEQTALILTDRDSRGIWCCRNLKKERPIGLIRRWEGGENFPESAQQSIGQVLPCQRPGKSV